MRTLQRKTQHYQRRWRLLKGTRRRELHVCVERGSAVQNQLVQDSEDMPDVEMESTQWDLSFQERKRESSTSFYEVSQMS